MGLRRPPHTPANRLTAPTLRVAGGWLRITTLEGAPWSAADVLAVSRVRWQVDLVLKKQAATATAQPAPQPAPHQCGRDPPALLIAWALHASTPPERRPSPRDGSGLGQDIEPKGCIALGVEATCLDFGAKASGAIVHNPANFIGLTAATGGDLRLVSPQRPDLT